MAHNGFSGDVRAGYLSKQAAQITRFLELLDKVAERSIENLNKAVSMDACLATKQAWGKKPIAAPGKGVVERMINLPFKYPKLTMLGGGLGLGYWLSNKNNTTNNYYQEGAAPDYQP